MSTSRFSKRFKSMFARRTGPERVFMYVTGGLFMVFFFALVFGFLIKWLWNVTMPGIFSLPAISYWQAIGLFILAKFIFGFGSSHGPRAHHKKHRHHGEKSGWGRDQEVSAEADSLSDLADDESFKKYWDEEGRQAYEAFVASRQPNPNGVPQE